MSIYGIELLGDNVAECRANVREAFVESVGVEVGGELDMAAANVLALNIVHGDALSMMTRDSNPQPITFAEWAYLGKGKFRRRDFRFHTLTQISSLGEGTLFADLSTHEIFTPARDHGVLSVADIAGVGHV